MAALLCRHSQPAKTGSGKGDKYILLGKLRGLGRFLGGVFRWFLCGGCVGRIFFLANEGLAVRLVILFIERVHGGGQAFLSRSPGTAHARALEGPFDAARKTMLSGRDPFSRTQSG